MNGLVSIKRNHGEDHAFTTSMIVAEGTGNQHKSVAALIRKHKKRFERWGTVEFSDLKSLNSKRGRPTKIAHLNEEQAYFLITLLDNNEKVADFKAELVDQFFKAKKMLAERKTEDYQNVRLHGKGMRREFTDAIKEYVELAKAQGHHGTAKFAYSNLTKLVKKPFGAREGADAGNLAMIAATEHILGATLSPLVRAGMDAKDIYNIIKQKSEALTGVMLPALKEA